MVNKYQDQSRARAEFFKNHGKAESFARCLGKVRFRSKTQADLKIQEVLAAHGQRQRAYLCPHCLNYHLTSKRA